jgi:hypothetical protein
VAGEGPEEAGRDGDRRSSQQRAQRSGAATKGKNPKSEIRNKFKLGEKGEMRKTGGGGLSANFANFCEFFGRGILTGNFEHPT